MPEGSMKSLLEKTLQVVDAIPILEPPPAQGGANSGAYFVLEAAMDL